MKTMVDVSNIRVVRPPLTGEAAQRLVRELSEAHSTGKPLGSRAPHIIALCGSLELLVEQVKSSFTLLKNQIEGQEVCTRLVEKEFDLMILETERLISTASSLIRTR